MKLFKSKTDVYLSIKRIAIIHTTHNLEYSSLLTTSCIHKLKEFGYKNISTISVSGIFDLIPEICKLFKTDEYDCIILTDIILNQEPSYNTYFMKSVENGILDMKKKYNIPIINGILIGEKLEYFDINNGILWANKVNELI